MDNLVDNVTPAIKRKEYLEYYLASQPRKPGEYPRNCPACAVPHTLEWTYVSIKWGSDMKGGIKCVRCGLKYNAPEPLTTADMISAWNSWILIQCLLYLPEHFEILP